MKIKSIQIEGMHNVEKKTYTFNDITYLVGNNGSGKSTVLDAIQLALLGYIPGSAKTNEGIMKHASGKTMSVTLTLDNDGSSIVVSRSWMSAGSSVKSLFSIQPEVDLKDILKDIELPIFNFSEFTSLSANKLKEWFIKFLPTADSDTSWSELFAEAIADKEVLDNTLVDETVTAASALPGVGIEHVKNVNAMLKENISYTNGRIKSLQGTIDSLVFYDDAVEYDRKQIMSEISEIQRMQSDLRAYLGACEQAERIASQIAATEKLLEGEDISKYDKMILDADSEIDELMKESSELSAKISTLQEEALSLKKLAEGKGVCPFTSRVCNDVKAASDSAAARIEEIKLAVNELTGTRNQLNADTNIQSLRGIKLEAERHIQSVHKNEAALESLKSAATVLPPKPDTELTLDELDAKLSVLNTNLAKAAANFKYNELVDKVTAEKYVLENALEIYKIWEKLTGANGIQTAIMTEPFESLEEDMTYYLSQMFGNPVKAHFNLSEKANSFSFGLIRNGEYLTFDVLSSGEKCLYTIALMMCIVLRCNSPLKVIIVDDLLDHLDKPNAEFTFKALANVKDCQMIFAGVQPCSLKSIMVEVSK